MYRRNYGYLKFSTRNIGDVLFLLFAALLSFFKIDVLHVCVDN